MDFNTVFAPAIRNSSKRVKTMVWLALQLGFGPTDAVDILDGAKAMGIDRKTLYQAARDLGVWKKRIGFEKGSWWQWSLIVIPTIGADPVMEAISALAELYK